MDFYKILSIEKNATKAQVKKAYTSLALLYHPDKNPDSKEKFQEIKTAYENIIKQLNKKSYSEKSQNYAVCFAFPLETFIEYKTTTIHCECKIECECASREKCEDCVIGTITEEKDGLAIERVCKNCKGKRYITNYDHDCKECDDGLKTIKELVEVDLTKGEYNMNVFENKGNQQIGYLRGDLFVQIQKLPHPLFMQQGNDLVYYKWISFEDSFFGVKFGVEYCNETVIVEVDNIITNDTQVIVKEKGMNREGNLIVKFKVRVPYLTEEQQLAIQKILKK